MDVELVHQSSRSTEAKPEAGSGGEMIGECLLDVRDAWTLILECNPQSSADPVGDQLEPSRPAATVIDRVASELARGRDHLRLVDERKPSIDRPRANGLANGYDVGPGTELQQLSPKNCHPARWRPSPSLLLPRASPSRGRHSVRCERREASARARRA